jgi:hypothetical protein
MKRNAAGMTRRDNLKPLGLGSHQGERCTHRILTYS